MKNNLIEIIGNISPIFYELVFSSIKACIVGLIILFVLKLLKSKLLPSTKYIVWLIFIIMLISPFEIQNNFNMSILKDNLEIIYEADNLNDTDGIHITNVNKKVNENIDNFVSNNINEYVSKNNFELNFKTVLPLIFFSITIIGILLIVYIFIHLYDFNNKNRIIDEKIIEILKKCTEKLNIDYRKVSIFYDGRLKSIGTTGIINLKIKFNKNIVKLSNKQIELIIMHELAHYKRKDNVIMLINHILRVIYCFNPLVWILLGTIEEEMEYSSDLLAVSSYSTFDKKVYCDLLLETTMDRSRFFNGIINFSPYKGSTDRRVANIRKFHKTIKFKKLYLVISIILVTILVLCFGGSKRKLEIFDIEKILGKTSEISNFYLKEKYQTNSLDELEYETYFKDDLLINKLISSGNYSFKNGDYSIKKLSNSNKYLIEDISSKKIIYSSNEEKFNKYISLIESEDFLYQYLGKEKYNDIKCVVISLYWLNSGKFESYDLWIDSEKGVVLKEEYYYNEKSNTKPKTPKAVNTYDYQYDVVTDEDMRRLTEL